MGFTSPLWMVWNALGWLLTHDPVGWSRLWATLADMITLVCGAHLIERHVSRPAAWCFAFAIAAWVAFTGVAISGMENGVLVALSRCPRPHGIRSPASRAWRWRTLAHAPRARRR